MKTEFPGYFKPTDSEIKDLWKNCTFSFDANFLLNLYRYSKETRSEVFKVVEKIRDRVWIPHQAAFEFLENRLPTIRDAVKSYDSVQTEISKIVEIFKSPRHPHVDNSLLDDFVKLNGRMERDLEARKNDILKLIDDDPILEEISTLTHTRIGPPYSESELSKIFSEGEKRYKAKVPPGYRDEKKDDSRKYGDLLIWYQLIRYAEAKKLPVIFVTADEKDDWWSVPINGRAIGPRPELIAEMKTKAGVQSHFYTPESFLKSAQVHLKQKVTVAAMAEVEDTRAEKVCGSINSEDIKRTWEYLIKENILKLNNQDILLKFAKEYASSVSNSSLDPWLCSENLSKLGPVTKGLLINSILFNSQGKEPPSECTLPLEGAKKPSKGFYDQD